MIKNKVAIVTGATKGIGFELTKLLIQVGVKVAACARDIEPLIKLVSSHEVDDSRFYIKTVDVKNEAEIISFVNESVEKFSEVNYLFNNVGMNTEKAEIFNITTSYFDDMMSVNLRAPMIFTREVSRIMVEKKTKGTIINTHSTCDLFSNSSTGSYTASKAGFDALSKVFRKELRDYEIKVMNVYPGGTDTPFREAERKDYLRPEHVAQAMIKQLTLANEVYLDDIVLRPLVERNF